MGRRKNKKPSSDFYEEEHHQIEENEDEVTNQKNRKRMPTYSDEQICDEEEVKFGEQLLDDLINTFCDKLQAVCPRKLEGLLAIQSVMIANMEEIRKLVTGEHIAIQVLYERKRSHYVLVYYHPGRKHLKLYDSLQRHTKEGKPKIFSDISKQIIHLFGHVYPEEIPVAADDEYEPQTDNFSCGYRVIGTLVDIARRRNPSKYIYSRSAILAFLRNILNEPKPTWEMFKNAELGFEKDYSGEFWRVEPLQNSNLVTPAIPSSDVSPDNSQDSQELIGSEEIAHELDIRARAGHENHHEEHQQESHLDRLMRCFHTWNTGKTVASSPEASTYGYIMSTFHYLLNGLHKT